MKITVKETRKGQYLVCSVIPAVYGIGIKPVGSFCGGYTTSHQFGVFDSSEEAQLKVEEIFNKYAASSLEFVEWLPPQDANPQFVDLPRLYPSFKKTRYETKADVENAGWIHIVPNKTLEWYKGQKIYCADVSPGRSFGYTLAIAVFVDGELKELERSVTITTTKPMLQCSPRFRMVDVVDAIYVAREHIDKLKR